MKSSCLLLLLGLSLSLADALDKTERPIIGVVSQKHSSSSEDSYIAASYVKFLESAGARVVPILQDYTEEQITELFGYINGVLFPGGGANLNSSGYGNVGQVVFKLATKANDNDDYFPVWGTCLGFQLLAFIVAGNDNSVLSATDATNLSLPLEFIEGGSEGHIYSQFTPDAISWVSNEPITFNSHHWGVTTETFRSNQRLNQFFTVLSTNKGRKGVEFVSSMEAKNYPIYGVQFHPEKNGFEWIPDEVIPHSQHAVNIMQSLANFFVQEARQSGHRFPSKEKEAAALIYNYPPVYTNSYFVQEYHFE